MMVGAFILPLALLIWRESRITAVLIFVAGALSAVGVGWMYEQMGWVKLLGLPHVIFYTPLAIFLFSQIGRADMPKWPRWIMVFSLATILISLAFDYTDVIRYFLGNTTPLALPASA